jgi:hypothetical protein
MYLFMPLLKELYGGGGASASVVSEFMVVEFGWLWKRKPWESNE